MFAYCNSNPVIAADYSGKQEVNDVWWLDGSGASCRVGTAPLYSYAFGGYTSSFDGFGGSLSTSNSGIIDGMVFGATITISSIVASSMRRGNGGIYTVYFLTDPQHEKDPNAPIYYVGRVKTVNKTARFEYHKNTRELVPAFYYDGLTYEQARGIEEMGMVAYGSLRHVFPFNIIHGISPRNTLRELYLHDGLDYLSHKVEQEVLELYESLFN